MELPDLRGAVYRYCLLTLLGATEAVSRADYNLPSKWQSIFEGFRASSGMAHGILSTVDEEVEEEYREKQEMLEKRLGKQKFYDSERLRELKRNYPEMET
ncbi:MAG: hypothetical protein ABEJ03_05900 [Candidatus Nanohaloarchaea archaeon]